MSSTSAMGSTARSLLHALLGAAPLLLAACGGGDQLASGGIVGTGISISSVGTVSAIGSVTVNGVRFATTTAAVTVNGVAAPEAALKVGMVVAVQGKILPDGTATAISVDARTEVKGIVNGVDNAARAFTVLGQRLRTDQLTVYSGGNFDTLLNQYVEVSGFRGVPGELLATRVDISPTVAPGAVLEVTGTVSAFDPIAKNFAIGAQLVDFSQLGSAFVPSGLANGVVADVHGATVSAGGRLVANDIRIVPTAVPGADNSKAEIEGVITDFASIASFRVNGQAIDGRSATVTGGTATMVANGAKVEVEGQLTQGVVVASKIVIEQDADIVLDAKVEAIDSTGITLGGQRFAVTATTQYEDQSAMAIREFSLAAIRVGDRLSLHATRSPTGLVATRVVRLDASAPVDSGIASKAEGVITDFVSVGSFKVAGRAVNAGSAKFEGGVAADLANGRRVEVEGVLAGDILMATGVTFIPADSTPASPASLVGAITDFVSPAAFKVAGQSVDASRAAFADGGAANLANGRRVSVSGTVTGGVLVATNVTFQSNPPATTLEVQGAITDFASATSFRVSGQAVDASKATIANGTLADLVNGRRVTADGPLVGGVLKATKVEIMDAPEVAAASVEGAITDFVSVANFKVAARRIDASRASFENGTAANLANGRTVEVEGKLSGEVLVADKLSFQ